MDRNAGLRHRLRHHLRPGGPGGEVWKLENEIYGFVNQCCELLTDNSLAVLINSYTAGVSPAVMSYILNSTIVKDFGGKAEADEIGLKVSDNGLVLPFLIRFYGMHSYF